MGSGRHNGILMSLLLLVAETINMAEVKNVYFFSKELKFVLVIL